MSGPALLRPGDGTSSGQVKAWPERPVNLCNLEVNHGHSSEQREQLHIGQSMDRKLKLWRRS
jgi:hypothetical protein